MFKVSKIEHSPGVIIGIDPGKKGGLAILEGNNIVRLSKTPVGDIKARKAMRTIIQGYDVTSMVELLKGFENKYPIAVIERVHAMPGQGVTSMFSFGQGFGLWLGACTALNIPIVLVEPQEWKGKLLDKEERKFKKFSCERAKELFPGIDLKQGRMIKDHDGMAEAVLIAVYGGMQLWQ